MKTEEGSPQGGSFNPLLANIYLNEYDQEMARRGVLVIRYVDDIVVLAKSKRAAQRLLGTTQRYLEAELKLKMNVEKSKIARLNRHCPAQKIGSSTCSLFFQSFHASCAND